MMLRYKACLPTWLIFVLKPWVIYPIFTISYARTTDVAIIDDASMLREERGADRSIVTMGLGAIYSYWAENMRYVQVR